MFVFYNQLKTSNKLYKFITMKKLFLMATMSLFTTGLLAKNLEYKNSQTKAIVFNKTITAEFSGYDADFNGYHFSYLDDQNEGVSISFAEISEEALANFDLKSDSFIGKTFVISYDTKMIEATVDGESYQAEMNSIISLELE